MTDSNAFFRFIWRINALTILAITVIGILTMAAVTGMFGVGERNVVSVQTKSDEAAAAPRPVHAVKIGDFQPSAPSVFEAPLNRTGTDLDRPVLSSGFKGGGAETALNVVFFNSQTGETRRIFPHDNGLVLRRHALRVRDQEFPLAHLYVYVAADSTGDQLLTDADAKRVVLVRPDGGSMIALADGVDEFDRAEAGAGRYGDVDVKADAPKLRGFVRQGEEIRYLEVDLNSFEVTRGPAVALPKL